MLKHVSKYEHGIEFVKCSTSILHFVYSHTSSMYEYILVFPFNAYACMFA